MAMANPGEPVECGQPLSADWLNYILENAGGSSEKVNKPFMSPHMIFSPLNKSDEAFGTPAEVSHLEGSIQGVDFSNVYMSPVTDRKAEELMKYFFGKTHNLGKHNLTSGTSFSGVFPMGNIAFGNPLKAGISLGKYIMSPLGRRYVYSGTAWTNWAFAVIRTVSNGSNLPTLVNSINLSIHCHIKVLNTISGNITNIGTLSASINENNYQIDPYNNNSGIDDDMRVPVLAIGTEKIIEEGDILIVSPELELVDLDTTVTGEYTFYARHPISFNISAS